MLYENRAQAGRILASRLQTYAGQDLIVLGLPRGGVPVAFEVALALSAPLDVLVVRKLPSPLTPELAVGAVASGGARVVNEETARSLGVTDADIDALAREEEREIERRERVYREGRPPLPIKGKTAIVVDDGLATGATMRAAVKAVRGLGARRTVAAVPVGAREICELLREDADDVVCAAIPAGFFAVGNWYLDFSQTSDEEVRDLLARARPAEAGRRRP